MDDVFPGGDEDASELRINADFASQFDRENTRRDAQRLADATARTPLSEAAIHVLIRCAKRTVAMVRAKLLRSKTRGAMDGDVADAQVAALDSALTPAVIAAAALSRANYRCSVPAMTLLDLRAVDDPNAAAALDRVVGHSQLQKQLTGLALFLLRPATTIVAPDAKIDASKPVPTVAGLGSKRRRDVELSSSKAAEPSASPLASAVDCPAHMRVISDVATTPLPARSVILVASSRGASSERLATERLGFLTGVGLTRRSNRDRIHGRGAGSGRGLGPHGEPAFDDLHPSWQAKRRVARREAKTVSKKLRALRVGQACAIRE